jgi:hypothetical protein
MDMNSGASCRAAPSLDRLGAVAPHLFLRQRLCVGSQVVTHADSEVERDVTSRAPYQRAKTYLASRSSAALAPASRGPSRAAAPAALAGSSSAWNIRCTADTAASLANAAALSRQCL